ncbi:zf-PARP-domain-containing protein [Jaminaea rosea]|uniref:Zf-PARP-domain-containing protein n=1 Tax=Jaminaea rosea TaxID=1569628 RepID=A0A316UXX5_9BASI|nr:zf-PARP-domain-containing protein [Jaminaea rosea]PWN30156.1 zf-PARP-domain-containing protein [Jaminaea rosea]
MPVSGVYRLEVAKTGAAVCQEVSCKAAQIKIDKGCPRIGVLVQLPNIHSKTGDHAEIQSFKWRHWFCLTKRTINNMKAGFSDEIEDFDGWDELHPDDQEPIKRVFDRGFVHDSEVPEDIKQRREAGKPPAKADPEHAEWQNQQKERAKAITAALKEQQKARDAAAKANGGVPTAVNKPPPEPEMSPEPESKVKGKGKDKGPKAKTEAKAKKASAAKGGRGKKRKADSDEEEDAPAQDDSAGPSGGAGLRLPGDDDEEEDIKPKIKKPRGRPPKKAAAAADDAEEDVKPKVKKPRGRPPKNAATAAAGSSNGAAASKKRGRKAKQEPESD